MENVLKRVKALNVEHDTNISQVSCKCGFSKSTLYRKLNMGGDQLTIGEIKKMAESYSMPFNEFVTYLFF